MELNSCGGMGGIAARRDIGRGGEGCSEEDWATCVEAASASDSSRSAPGAVGSESGSCTCDV